MKTRILWLLLCALMGTQVAYGQHLFRVISYNVENLFDTADNPLTDDEEFLPQGSHHWTPKRYNHKLQQIAKVITAAGEWTEPALVGLCEVENDSTLDHLCRRTPLRTQAYRFVSSETDDPRGIRVALLYQRDQFALLGHTSLRIPFRGGKKLSRPLLHVWGKIATGDTLDVFVCHFPSRSNGQLESEPFRIDAARHLRRACDSLYQLRQHPHLLVMGDFNDTPTDRSMVEGLKAHPYVAGLAPHAIDTLTLYNLFATKRTGQPKGTHKYRGEWSQLDHFLIDASFLQEKAPFRLHPEGIRIFDADFLWTTDKTYQGRRPLRSFYGFTYEGGFSDHLPLIVDFYIHLSTEKEQEKE